MPIDVTAGPVVATSVVVVVVLTFTSGGSAMSGFDGDETTGGSAVEQVATTSTAPIESTNTLGVILR